MASVILLSSIMTWFKIYQKPLTVATLQCHSSHRPFTVGNVEKNTTIARPRMAQDKTIDYIRSYELYWLLLAIILNWETGLLQGCMLGPLLFLSLIVRLMLTMFSLCFARFSLRNKILRISQHEVYDINGHAQLWHCVVYS